MHYTIKYSYNKKISVSYGALLKLFESKWCLEHILTIMFYWVCCRKSSTSWSATFCTLSENENEGKKPNPLTWTSDIIQFIRFEIQMSKLADFFFFHFFSIEQGTSSPGMWNWNQLGFSSFIFIFRQCV